MEFEPIDRKLIMLESYVKAFEGSIAKAKEAYPEHIENKINSIEEALLNKESARYKALQALKENRDNDYYFAMTDIKRDYDIHNILTLQGAIMKTIREEQGKDIIIPEKKEKNERERPTEQITVPAEKKKTPRESFEDLVEKYNNQMYDLRQKVEANEASGEEFDAFMAYNIKELITISKRKDGKEIVREEADLMKKYLIRSLKNNHSTKILDAYKKELNEIGINVAKIMQKRLNGF